MHVQVVHLLSAVLSRVDYAAITSLGQALGSRYLSGHEEQVPQHGLVFGADSLDADDGFPGDDEYVNGRLRLNVPKGHTMVVFVNNIGRNLPAQDLGEYGFSFHSIYSRSSTGSQFGAAVAPQFSQIGYRGWLQVCRWLDGLRATKPRVRRADRFRRLHAAIEPTAASIRLAWVAAKRHAAVDAAEIGFHQSSGDVVGIVAWNSPMLEHGAALLSECIGMQGFGHGYKQRRRGDRGQYALSSGSRPHGPGEVASAGFWSYTS